MAAVSPSLISRGGNEGSEFVCRAIVIAAPASSIQSLSRSAFIREAGYGVSRS